MIKDNLLGDKLNEFRKKLDINETRPKSFIDPIFSIINSMLLLITLIGKSIIFGYSIKMLFALNWEFWAFVSVGFTFNYILTFIYDLVRHK